MEGATIIILIPSYEVAIICIKSLSVYCFTDTFSVVSRDSSSQYLRPRLSTYRKGNAVRYAAASAKDVTEPQIYTLVRSLIDFKMLSSFSYVPLAGIGNNKLTSTGSIAQLDAYVSYYSLVQDCNVLVHLPLTRALSDCKSLA